MRFVPEGPSIPEELLEQCDNGNVVFLCGAGVSRPAGLPTFPELTRDVGIALGATDHPDIRRLVENPADQVELDQVFSFLQNEYGWDEVEREATRLLRTPRRADVQTHSIVLRLSRSAVGQPQVVTTNFDLLFEKAARRTRFHVGPSLPDLASTRSFNGIVYLHGRCAHRPDHQQDHPRLILSSSDLGRAYLAEGWATRFVRDLLETYYIVLLGYRASDPPVKYLLEGLRSRRRQTAANIFAFDSGPSDVVTAHWREMGVQALPFVKVNGSHAPLWDTLRAWATRRDDPDAWRRSVIDLAQRGPRDLQAHERGQVASLVRGIDGAIAFAHATPPPPAEWLCVFDRLIRYGEPQRAFDGTSTDPLERYGLDDDPPREEEQSKDEDKEPPGEDLLRFSPADERTDRYNRLAIYTRLVWQSLPPRLTRLSGWIAGVADDPTTIWWAGGYAVLQPQLTRAIQWHLEHRIPTDHFSQRVWTLLFERLKHSPDRNDHGWFGFTQMVKKVGWTSAAFRELERAIQPNLGAKRSGDYPPEAKPAYELDELVDFEVVFPANDDDDEVEIPDPQLPAVFEIARRALERGAILLADIETGYWRTTTLLPEDQPGDVYHNAASKFHQWVKRLFDRLSVLNPDMARAEILRWPENDRYFFNKLKIYAWMKRELVPAAEVAEHLAHLSDDTFWDEHHRRELLHTLVARWSDFGATERTAMEQRLLAGDPTWPAETPEEFRIRTQRYAATAFGWLLRQGCELSEEIQQLLPELRKADPSWAPVHEQFADQSLDTRASSVATDTDPGALLALPISEIIPAVRRLSGRDYDRFVERAPLRGLIQHSPRRVLAALRWANRRGDAAAEIWGTLLSFWPAGSSSRLLVVCAGRLTGLDASAISQMRHAVARWFKECGPPLAATHPHVAFALFDHIAGALEQSGEEATRSTLGDVTVGGKAQRRSRHTYDHTINGPVGQITDGLRLILIGRKLPGGSGIPADIATRLERLLRMPGEGAAHAASEIALEIRWLYYLDSTWVRAHVLPMLAPAHALAEPAWNGLLHGQDVPQPELFGLLKPHFLEAFTVASQWRWDRDTAHNKLVEVLLVACYWKRNDRRYVSLGEARTALKLVDDSARAHAVWYLATNSHEMTWAKFGQRFFAEAWPRELRFRSPAVSRQLAFLAEQSGDDFPKVVAAISRLLVPASRLDTMVHQAKRGGDKSPAARFPEATMALLDRLTADDPRSIPWELRAVLHAIAEGRPELRADHRWKRLNRIANRA